MDELGSRLLREIQEQPEDDGPRLVYADWLLAHATDPAELAHAELIHLQCRAASTHPADLPAIQARANAILKQHKRTWVAPLTRAGIRGTWQFRRGFLDAGSRMSARRFVEVAPRLFELAPMLRAMTFPEAANEVAGLAASPYLARLDEVSLHELCRCGRCKTELELPALFASPHVGNLRVLVLSACRMETANARRLFAAEQLGKLRELDLRDNRIEGAALTSIGATTFRRLVLAGNPLGAAGARALAEAGLVVEELDLADCAIDREGARALVDAPWAEGVRRLVLHGNPIDQGPERSALRERFGDRLEL